MKLKQILIVIAVSMFSAITSVILYTKWLNHAQKDFVQSTSEKKPSNYVGFFDNPNHNGAEAVDFTKAADATVPCVVHIKTTIKAKKIDNSLPNRKRSQADDLFQQFFGQDMFSFGPMVKPEQRASGSGVIISDDGYIVTNNHVVVEEGTQNIADEITVTLSNAKTYKAKIIGRDASTDLAVLKIQATSLPYLVYGNSDMVKLGQWVLAVGYPFSLETTVTAGIISAKGRSIDINSQQSQTPVESFIQTDAVVNPGNSGGALINTEGQLIGINSAIYAPNGTYAGYSFAIPINLVKKVVNDIIKFGDVKRPYLGIAPDEDFLTSSDGAHINAVAKNGAAIEAGLQKGDIITKINDNNITTWNQLQATVSSLNVGEKINIEYKRDGKLMNTTATLKADAPKIENLAATNLNEKLGVELQTLDATTSEKNDIEGGVLIKKINANGWLAKKHIRVEEGFVITSVSGTKIRTIEELSSVLRQKKNETVYLQGFYPGFEGNYQVPLNLSNTIIE